MRRARRGDSAASHALFARHLPELRRRVRRRLPPALRPRVGDSDVVQEACVAAFQRLHEFDDRGDGSFLRWLRKILDHKLVDEVRRHVGAERRDLRREVRVATGEEPSARRRKGRSPPSEVVAAEEQEAVRRAMTELPSHYRAVLRWIHHEGLTAAEAGVRMGRTPDAARKLYARALARLADRLDARRRETE